jgi:hypothetical protein
MTIRIRSITIPLPRSSEVVVVVVVGELVVIAVAARALSERFAPDPALQAEASAAARTAAARVDLVVMVAPFQG